MGFTSKKKIYYCDIPNFGDKLNEAIFSNIFNTEIVYSDIKNAEIIAIGSILDKVLCRHFNFFNPKDKLKIFSSGFGFDKDYYLTKFKYAKPLKIKRNIEVLALRGKYTKKNLEDITKSPLGDVVLGDAGLLAGKLLKDEIIDKKYDVGIVPHYADKDNRIFVELNQNIPNSTILDTTESVMDFMRHLAQCKTIVSTAMHPLIAADSLNIPNLWVRISEKTTSRFKFLDYYSIFGISPVPIDLNNTILNISKEFIENEYKVPYQKVISVQRELINVYNSNIDKEKICKKLQ